ncbi:STAS-like domain-containing protein [Campylobacter californiensis]|uniref:STAS-like domain-containing protein n=1 Tax=Campylobacter californiensis TaxID=1032243 RepID=UPI0014738E90|nr:STAS-like domain-containing protein [Campylobacter sp. RM12916]MBE3610509.1 STAS-like domain-containing protein [Campylobacter sp. RM12916]
MQKEATIYDFAKEFTPNPGLRFESMTPGVSGEKFREDVLRKFFKDEQKIIIDVRGVESNLGSSFLSESFGNIAVEYGIEKFNEIIDFDQTTPKGEVTYKEMMLRVKEALKRASK